MSIIHTPQKPELNARQAGFLVLVGIAIVAMLGRLWYLQVVEADQLVDKATSLRTVAVKRLAPRGLIFDRRGVLIAGVEPKWVVTAVPSLVKSNPWVLDKLSAMLQVEREKLEVELKENGWRPHFPTPIYVGASITVATRIAESGDYLPGIDVITQPMRSYTNTTDYSHLMGYVWTPSAQDVERIEAKKGDVPDYVGKDGIEREYEIILQGARGLDRYEVDNKRRPKREVERRAPQSGSRITLSIDSDLQTYATAVLRGHRGSIVVLEPSTGEVLAMVSSPTFDTKLFEGGISLADYRPLADDKSFPLMNRATGGAYPPGSAFKIVTTVAHYLAGKFDPHRTVYCPGYHQLGTKKTKCLGVHRAVSFHRAFQDSCNTYFATIGREAGLDKLQEAAAIFGIGAKTGIDLPGERRGLFPFDDWLNDPKKPRVWYPGDVVNTSIGQGYVQTTPLQMACVAAMVANEGVYYRPHMIHSVNVTGRAAEPKLVEPTRAGSLDLPPSVWRELKNAMVAVIDSGTATSARIPNLRWGGKTGSSEHRVGAKTHGWFIGVAPIDDPKIAIAVLIEAQGHGGVVAAPIARGVVERYFAKLANESRAALNASSRASNSALVGEPGP